MDLKTLQQFKIVYEKKSLNQAAKEVFMTTQGISRVISNLEEQLGTELFERSSKGVIPNSRAHILYEHADELISQFEKIQQAIQADLTKNSTIRIGFAQGTLNALSAEAVFGFIQDSKDIDVSWSIRLNDEIKEGVQQFKLDAGIVIGDTIPDDLDREFIKQHSLVLLVYEGHPLYNRKSVHLKEIENENILLMDEQFQIYHDFVSRCEQSGFSPKVKLRSPDSHFLYQMCKQKVGLGVLIDFTTSYFSMAGVRAVNFDEPIPWNLYRICHQKHKQYPNIEKFTEYIKSL